MIKKPKKLIYFFAVFLIGFLLLTVSYSALALEVQYPHIPGFSDIKNGSTLPDYINYFFGFIMVTAGIIAVISIAIGGLRMLISAGNPGARGEAMDRIFGGVLGIILLMFSYVILETINPQLVNLQETSVVSLNKGMFLGEPKEGQAMNNNSHSITANFAQKLLINNPLAVAIAKADGSFYSQFNIEDYDITPLPESIINRTFKPGSFVWNNCPGCVEGDGPGEFLRVTYRSEGEEFNDDDTAAKRVHLPDIEPTDENFDEVSFSLYGVKDLDWAEKTPGIYLFKTDDCTGLPTRVITSSGQIPPGFQNQVRSAQILNGNEEGDPRYGFILNTSPDLKGTCSQPFMNYEASDPDYEDGEDHDSEDEAPCFPIINDSPSCDFTVPQTHNVCVNQTCTQVDGVGDNACNTSSDCLPQTHNECVNQACQEISGAGDNKCTSNSECLPTCNTDTQKCEVGGGGKSCNSDSECTTSVHNECVNQACQEVSGAGDNKCTSNSQNQCVEGGTVKGCDIANGDADCTAPTGKCSTNPSQTYTCSPSNNGAPCTSANVCKPRCNSQNKCVQGLTEGPECSNLGGDCTASILVTKECDPVGDQGRFFMRKDGQNMNGPNTPDIGCGESASAQVTPGRDYIISEAPGNSTTDLSKYDTVIGGECDRSGRFTAKVGVNRCTITNNKKHAYLQIKKECSPTDDTGHFDLRIDGITTYSQNMDCVNNTTTPRRDVGTGTHTVSELAGSNTNLFDYTTTIDCGSGATSGTSKTITLQKDDDKLCTITNTKKPPGSASIKVVKQCNPSSDPGRFKATINGEIASNQELTCTGPTSSVTINVSPGNYLVGEVAGSGTNLSQYNPPVFGGDCTQSGQIIAEVGKTNSCIITNSPKTASSATLRFHKTVFNSDNNGSPDYSPNDFGPFTLQNTSRSYTFNVDASGDAIITNIVPDTYSIIENYQDYYEATYTGTGGACNGNNIIPLGPGETKECIIFNRWEGGILVLHKIIKDGDLKSEDFLPFIYDADLDYGQFYTWGVPIPVYAGHQLYVSEIIPANSNYTGQFAPPSDCDAHGGIILDVDQWADCNITNTYQPSPSDTMLTVIKKVVGGPLDGQSSQFRMTIAGSAGPAVQGDNSFPGTDDPGTPKMLSITGPTDYRVEETSVSGYTMTYYNNCSGTINPGDHIICSITNTYQLGAGLINPQNAILANVSTSIINKIRPEIISLASPMRIRLAATVDDRGGVGSDPIAFPASYIYVIKGYNPGNPEIDTPGTGVSLYAGTRYKYLPPSTIKQHFILDGTTDCDDTYQTCWPYTNTDDLLKEIGDIQPGFGQNQDIFKRTYIYPCTQYIDHQGSYLTVLYTQNQGNTYNQTCSTFINSVDFIRDTNNIPIGSTPINNPLPTNSNIDVNSDISIFDNNKYVCRVDIFPILP